MEPAPSSMTQSCRHSAKNKQSCDNCGASKIRCGRQHPRCQCYLERGIASPRRLNKHSATAFDEGAWSYAEHAACPSQSYAQRTAATDCSSSWTEGVTETHTGDNDRLDFDMTAVKKSSLGFHVDTHTQSQATFGQEPAAFEYDPNTDIDFTAIYSSLTPPVLGSSRSDELCDTVSKLDAVPLTQTADESSAGMGDQFSALFSLASDYQMAKRSPQDQLRDIEPCTIGSRTCIPSALKILRALHVPPSLCLSTGVTSTNTGSPQPRMLDSVLSTNQEAIRLLSKMLECTCSSNSQLQLVLTSICGKLMAWCRAMVRNDFNDSFAPSPEAENHVIDYEDLTERVSHQPITVGEYSINATLENKIRAQVVFSELNHVKTLTSTLSQRVENTNSGKHCDTSIRRSGNRVGSRSQPETSDGTGPAEAIHRSLASFLHSQLQAAEVEISSLAEKGYRSTCVGGQSSDMTG